MIDKRDNLDNVRNFMIKLAFDAGKIQMRHYGKRHDLDWTTLNNLKTEADKEVAELVWKKIEKAYPDYSIYTEEKTAKITGHKRMYVVDELDGTNPYAWGFSDYFSFCIALCEDGIPFLGVVYAPKRRECYIAQVSRVGRFATRNGFPIGVSYPPDLSKVWIGIDTGKTHRTSDIPFIQKAKSDGGLAGIVTCGCASVPLCLVASGKLHAYLGTNLEPEDMAAAVVVLLGAGAKVTTLDGHNWKFGDRTILVANPHLHEVLFDFFGLPNTHKEVSG